MFLSSAQIPIPENERWVRQTPSHRDSTMLIRRTPHPVVPENPPLFVQNWGDQLITSNGQIIPLGPGQPLDRTSLPATALGDALSVFNTLSAARPSAWIAIGAGLGLILTGGLKGVLAGGFIGMLGGPKLSTLIAARLAAKV